MKCMSNLKDNYKEIREILWTVYGIGSLQDGNDIVLYRDSESLGRVNATSIAGHISRGFAEFKFDVPNKVSYSTLSGSTACVEIENAGSENERRTIKIEKLDPFYGTNVVTDIKVNDRHICFSQTSYYLNDDFKFIMGRKEIAAVVSDEKGNLQACHYGIDYLNGQKEEFHNYLQTLSVQDAVLNERQSQLCTFASTCIEHVVSILPNDIDAFLASVNPIMYNAIRKPLGEEKEGEEAAIAAHDKKEKAAKQYSKQLFATLPYSTPCNN